MKKLDEKKCRIYEVLNFLSKRWNTFILLELSKEKNKYVRYNDLKNKLGNITPRAFSQRLKELEKWKVIEKKTTLVNNKKITKYKLSSLGIELLPIIILLRDWAKKVDKCKLEPECDKCYFIKQIYFKNLK
jgi:DNA-binding HxlR family transcriptional regulator